MGNNEDLRAAWRRLEGEHWTRPGSYELRLSSESVHALYAVLLRPSGIVGFAIDLPPGAGGDIQEDAARGFVLRKAWNDETGCVRLTLMVSELRYFDVFSMLACDVLARVLRANTAANGGYALRDRLAHWKKFLKTAGEEGLTIEEQTGLFGELFVLKVLIGSALCDPAQILLSWLGPSGANQDFSWQGRAIEIKSTTSNDASRVTVANERQLDEDGLECLFLCHLAFDRRAGAGETLPALIAELLSLLGESLIEEFMDRLVLAGYHRMHESRYGTHGYTFRFSGVYRVEGNFPRIKQHELRSGVGNVSYLADLSNISVVSTAIGHLASEIFSRQG